MVEPNDNKLSERENEILRLVATGASNKEIAIQLAISPNTVKVHLRNIFSKIGVASRTEATLYAIQHGYAPVPGGPAAAEAAAPSAPLPAEAPEPTAAPVPARRRWPLWLAGGALAAGLIGAGWWLAAGGPLPPPTPTTAVRVIQWEPRAPLPNARQGLAAAVYENQIYVIGGETGAGVTGRVERYDPAADGWTRLTDKPQPVADASAVVIGGRLFVPGGRTGAGAISAQLEVYDPRQDAWAQLAPLPAGRSAYAAVAFEGKLYVFGGWDGTRYTATTFEYDPDRDAWAERAPLHRARGWAGVAAAGDQLFLIGGTDGQRPLDSVEVYSSGRQKAGEPPWEAGRPLPAALAPAEALSLADVIYVIGTTAAGNSASFRLGSGVWETLGAASLPETGARLTVVGTTLHALGGGTAGAPSDRHLTFQAVYALFLPVITSGGDQGQDK